MLVMMMDDQIISPKAVCQSCCWADRSGEPRWRQGNLTCGHPLAKGDRHLPNQYECQMGFRIAQIG